METSQVSIFAVRAQANELRTRMQMTDIVNRRKMRHAHMVNIDRRIMLEGMRADFRRGGPHQHARCWQLASAARDDPRHDRRRARDITGTISNPNYQLAQDERHHQSRTSGATCRAARCSRRPGEVNGTFVIDGVVGDYLCEKYGDLSATPLTIRDRRATG